jgi:hypothetical protein
MTVVRYKPSSQDWVEAARKFNHLMKKYPDHPFKIGRCAAIDFPTLRSREEYSDAEAICGIWKGAKGKCSVFEEVGLTRFGGRFGYAAFFTECISSNSIGLL